MRFRVRVRHIDCGAVWVRLILFVFVISIDIDGLHRLARFLVRLRNPSNLGLLILHFVRCLQQLVVNIWSICSLRPLLEELTLYTLVEFLLLKNVVIDFLVQVISSDVFFEERVSWLILIQSPLGALAQAEGFRTLSHSTRNQGFGAKTWPRSVSIHFPFSWGSRLVAESLLKNKSLLLNTRILVKSMTLISRFCLRKLLMLILGFGLFLLKIVYPSQHTMEFTVL